MISGSNSGLLTPPAIFTGVLNRLVVQSPTAAPSNISALLVEGATVLHTLGDAALATQMSSYAAALGEGCLGRTDFIRSPLFDGLSKFHNQIAGGEEVEAVLKARMAAERLRLIAKTEAAGFQSISARDGDAIIASIGPAPDFRWDKFGTRLNPPFIPPEWMTKLEINRLPKLLDFFVEAYGGKLARDSSDSAVEAFYGISATARRRLRKLEFIPEEIGHFPSGDTAKILAKLKSGEPLYAELAEELMVRTFFDIQGWSQGLPRDGAIWKIHLLYKLRRYAAKQLLTEAGKRKITADRALIAVASNRASLEDVKWHPRRTRREVMEPWLIAINEGKPQELAADRRRIGDYIAKAYGWEPSLDSDPEEIKLQWMLRCWLCYYHYGSFPARGLPFETKDLIKFVMAVQPGKVSAEDKAKLLEMMKEVPI